MNFLLIAIFAACACLVNGQSNDSSDLKADDQNLVDENLSNFIKEEQNPNELNNGDTANTKNKKENNSMSQDLRVDDFRLTKYWPQIVIIKPMALYNPVTVSNRFKKKRPMRPGNYYTSATMYGKPGKQSYRPYSKINKIYRQTTRPSRQKYMTPHTTWSAMQTPSPEPEKTTISLPETTNSPPEYEYSEVVDESSCQTPNGSPGECISVYDCQPLLDLVNKKDRTSQDVEQLKKSQCGFRGSAPAVCCPKNEEPQPQPTQPPQPQAGTCYTPEGNRGQCISLYSCAHLANMLKPPVPEENIAYVQKSRCEGPEQYSVCCGPPPNLGKDVVPGNCEAKISAFPPDPRTECCGVDSRVGNKIVGGNATTVDQYPWLVMIEYVKQGVTKLLCGGALISGKYVLTAGHCIAGQVLDVGTPRRVRLGEYDISHEGKDCAPVEAGGEDCTDGVTRILIEKTIPHPQYNPVSPLKRNDIALIRLKEMAPFTDFIRPICLPTKDLTLPQNVPGNFTLYAAGWGAVSTRQSYSNVKLHVDLPFVNPDTCQPAYTQPGRSVTLWKGQLCAGGQPGKDSCKGDSGGPLMYEDGRTYELIGVVSFGPVPCGMDEIPGVYSKVYEYLDWIRSNIVP